MIRCFEIWLDRTGMTEAEKQECLCRAARGFAQPAEIFLLGASGKIRCRILRALGIRPARRQSNCRLGNWKIWPCSADRRQRVPDWLKESDEESDQKICVILLACAGKGSRLRARDAWNRGCDGVGELLREISVLAVQIEVGNRPESRLLDRQESGEARLQQAAADFLNRQVPAFTVPAGRSGRCSRERLWYQLAKLLSE